MDELKERCFSLIDKLILKYKDNEHMLKQLDVHVNQNLEQILTEECVSHETKKKMARSLEAQQTNFVKVFLSKNRYYYLSQDDAECFFEYDGKHYTVTKKDDINTNLLVTISNYKDLHEWKFEVTDMIMQNIKNRSLHNTVPESYTIQYVLKLLSPTIFSSRDAAKYFLTILGDSILKKNKENIYLPFGKHKGILATLENYAYTTIGHSGLTKNFVKYHENHNYSNCRLIHFEGERQGELSVNQALDLFCVACHYSTRFNGADEYISKKAGQTLKDYTLFVNSKTQEDIVNDFGDSMIDVISEASPSQLTYILKMKDMHFLWKNYMDNLKIPNIVYQSTVKQLLVNKYEFNPDTECFVNIASKHIPIVRKFIEFWETNILISQGEELELDELCILFKSENGNIDESHALNIIYHFFPQSIVVENKYLLHTSCKLWNKKKDMEHAMLKMKETYKNKNTQEYISFDDAYQYYYVEYKPKFIASKRYFEKFIVDYVKNFIVYGTFISNDWYMTN